MAPQDEPWVVPDLVFAIVNEILGLPDPVAPVALDELAAAIELLRAETSGA